MLGFITGSLVYLEILTDVR